MWYGQVLSGNKKLPDQVEHYLTEAKRLMYEGKRVVVSCIDDNAPIRQILEFAQTHYPGAENNMVLAMRHTGDGIVGGWDYTPYNDHATAEEIADWQYERHQELWKRTDNIPNSHVIWFSTDNEPDKDFQRYSIEWYAAYNMQLCRRAVEEGRRFMVMGWSGGTPEPDFWNNPAVVELLKFMRQYPDLLALKVHEYSFTKSMVKYDEVAPGEYELAWDYWHIGRFLRIPKDLRPTIFIAELGWTYDDMPDSLQALTELKIVWEEIYASTTVIGAAIWRDERGKLNERVNAIIPALTRLMIAYDDGLPDIPVPDIPPPPTTQDPKEVLVNGSFEDRSWTDINNQVQQPYGWEVSWFTGVDNPFQTDSGSWWKFGGVELVHVSRLPPGEMEEFGLSGERIIKLFSSHSTYWFRMRQTLNTGPGTYVFKPSMYVDVYEWNGGKVAPRDPNSVLMRIRINGEWLTEWVQLQPLKMFRNDYTFDITESVVDLEVHFMCPFAISNNGLWLDNWSLIKAREIVPEPRSLERFLWEDSMKKAKVFHEGALYKAIQEHMPRDLSKRHLSPFDDEVRVEFDGTRYVYQTALLAGPNSSETYRYVYYAPESDYNDIKIVDMNEGAEPDPEPEPEPVVQELIVISNPVSQRDERWRHKPMPEWEAGAKTYGAWGCLIASYYNMARYLNLYNAGDLTKFVDKAIKDRAMYRVDDQYGLRYNTAAHALRTMFPNAVSGGNWLTHKDEGMEEAIRASIRSGMPVPVHVDIDPSTPRIDQHWPLVVGYQMQSDGSTRYLMLDPYSLDPKPEFLDERYDIPGTDIREAIFYKLKQDDSGEPTTPPSTVLHNLTGAFRPVGMKGPRITLRRHTGETEPLQLQAMLDATKEYTAFVKGDGGQSWEGFFIPKSGPLGIYRTADLSHSHTTYYVLRNSETNDIVPWLPPVMRVGQWYERAVTVSVYDKKDCKYIDGHPHNGFARTYALLKGVYHNVTFPNKEMEGKVINGPVFDIIVSHTRSEANLIERYWFAEDIGLVQWWSADGGHSVIVEITEGQSDLLLGIPGCLDLTAL